MKTALIKVGMSPDQRVGRGEIILPTIRQVGKKETIIPILQRVARREVIPVGPMKIMELMEEDQQ
jgi:hypothetical protein